MPPGPVPPAIMRDGYRMMRKAQDKSPPTNLEVRDLEIPGGETPILARLYAPMGAAAATGLLVYFHGGGFVVGDLETHDGHCRRMASLSGHRVLAINYRLAPEHPFPAAHDDAVAVTRWAVDNAAALGADSRRVAVGGDSAGANLAASTALEMMNDAHRRLCFQLLLYPLTFPETETASRRAFDGPVISRAMLAGAAMAFAHRGHPAARRALLDARDFSGGAASSCRDGGHRSASRRGSGSGRASGPRRGEGDACGVPRARPRVLPDAGCVHSRAAGQRRGRCRSGIGARLKELCP